MSLNILVSNDDGYNAPGLIALAKELAAIGTVTVVAPDSNRSGASNSITLVRNVLLRQHEDRVFSLDGTPADCLQVAFAGSICERPDIVVSGINNGPNMGDDTLYSGTVGAAMEGRFLSMPPLAVSMATFSPDHFSSAAKVTVELIRQLLASSTNTEFKALTMSTDVRPVFNINVPDKPFEELKGYRVTRLGSRFAPAPATLKEQHSTSAEYRLGPAGEVNLREDGTDFHAVENGFVSVTPLKTDLTDREKLAGFEQFLGRSFTGDG